MTQTHRTREAVGGLLRAAMIGVCGGLASWAFRGLTVHVQDLVGIGRDMLEGARTLDWWLILAIPVGGALAAALVTRIVAGQGTGLTDVMEAVSVKSGGLSLRSAIGRSMASLCVIATGGSVGREGPIITISAAASSRISKWLRAPMRDRGVLLGCGVAAGFASAYHAPIAGAIFALEVVLGNFAVEMFAPVVVASVTSMLFTTYVAGGETVYAIPTGEFFLHSPFEVVPYLALGVLGGFVAVAFQWLLARSGRWFERIPGPRFVRMAVGGLAIGAIALAFPEVWGNGYESVSEILNKKGARFGPLTAEGSPVYLLVAAMVALMGVKMIGTALTVGSGGAGGVFTPTLFVGAALGGAFGAVVHEFAPHQLGPFTGYALVGMGCLVAGTTRAPIMAILVIFEMTLTYDIVLPLLLACVTSSYVARRLYPHSIYEEKLAERGTLLPPGIEETVLVTTRVNDIMRPDTPTWVTPSTTYREIVPLVTASRVSVVYVCEEGMQFAGVVRLHDVVQLANMGDLGPGIIAADLMVAVQPVRADQPLSEVFEVFEVNNMDELPVVDAQTRRKLIGVVTRRDVMATLHLEVLKRQNLRAKFVHRDDERQQTDYVELPPGMQVARVPTLPVHDDLTMAAAQIRTRHGLTVVSVVRRNPDGGEMRIVPAGDFVIRHGDEFIVLGSDDDLARWRAGG